MNPGNSADDIDDLVGIGGDRFTFAIAGDYVMRKTTDGGVLTLRFEDSNLFPAYICKTDRNNKVEWYYNLEYEK